MCEMTVRDFSFAYPQAEKMTLSSINMTFLPGSFNVICGRSGCGKSTLLRSLKPVLAPYGKREGEILYGGRSVEEMDLSTQTQKIGFVLQDPEQQVVTDKVWHELAFGLESLGLDSDTIRLRVAEMSSYFGIQEWIHRDVSELSGGQKQLLNLASVMAMHPEILILDEPTSQLDPIAASDFLETVKKINRDVGTTVILTEHRLQDVIPWADQVYVMEEGRVIAEGSPRQIGKALSGMHHGMFLSMPVPMQINAQVQGDLSEQSECPLTISEGRRWISRLMSVSAARMAGEGQAVSGADRSVGDSPVADSSVAEQPGKGASTASVIEVRSAWFRYERDGRDVVRDLNMSVKAGEFYAIVGGNGSGKSTTLSLLSRLRKPYRGKVLIDGKDICSYSDKELYRGLLGVLPQSPQSMFIKKTVREDLYAVLGGARENVIDPQAGITRERAVAGMAALCNLTHLLDRHPYDLSGGEQQRLALAKILLLRPRILLMDEPTKGMDGEFKAYFGQLIKRLTAHGLTVVMISHDVEFVAEWADRVAFFFDGAIVTSQPTRSFFSGNSFYTTAANRMARHVFPEAVTGKDVVACLEKIR